MQKIPYFLCLAFMLFSFQPVQVTEEPVPTKPEDVSPLLIGEQVPDLMVEDLAGKKQSLKALVAKQKTILIFYRGGWCPFCNKHLAALGKLEEKLRADGYQIVAISPDKASELKKTTDKLELPYTLLSDNDMEAAKQFGIAFQVSDEVLKKYKEYGIDLSTSSGGGNKDLLPVPSVFFLDKEGTIKFEYINPNFKERVPEALLLAAAKSMK
ncbi:MAG: peroxiredoxin-like family protein [Thermonemataceae bacterium]